MSAESVIHVQIVLYAQMPAKALIDVALNLFGIHPAVYASIGQRIAEGCGSLI